MKINDIPDIAEQYYDYNYIVSLADIMNTNICRDGFCEKENDKLIKAVLHIMGLDVNRPFEINELSEGQSHRSEITGLIQHGMYVYVGYERTCDGWKKRGKQNIAKYLFGDNKEIYKALMLIKE